MWKKDHPSRRDFLRGLGVAAGSLTLAGCPGGKAPVAEDDVVEPDNDTSGSNGSSSGIVVRHDVMSAEGQAQLDAYRAAITAMQGLDPSDPTSWRAQANIHLSWCPHGNAFFLPWHRGYLHYFEEVIRFHSGDPTFALPYWDWTTHPALPPAFFEGALNDPTRTIEPGEEIPPQFVGPQVIADILAINDFQTFASAYVQNITPGCNPPGNPPCCSASFDGKEQRASCGTGELEGTPHNNVHNLVGGNMRTYLSPLDPIFWLHHCNVDRLWMEWNKNHANGDFGPWRTFEFVDNFVDGEGVPQSIRVDQTFDTTALGYRYDTSPATESAQVPQASTVVAFAEASIAEPTDGDTLAVALTLPENVASRLEQKASGLETGTLDSLRLTLGGVAVPNQALAGELYVGAADSPGGSDSDAYVGTFGFFPTGEAAHEHGGHEKAFLFDIGSVVARMPAFDRGAPLNVHLRTTGLGAAESASTERVSAKRVVLEVVEHS